MAPGLSCGRYDSGRPAGGGGGVTCAEQVASVHSSAAPVALPKQAQALSRSPPLAQPERPQEGYKGFTMDPKEATGIEKEKEEKKEKEKPIKRRSRLLLRYLERRKTDTIVEDDSSRGDINIGTLIRRSQSDKTEYSAKLKGKLSFDPQRTCRPCVVLGL